MWQKSFSRFPKLNSAAVENQDLCGLLKEIWSQPVQNHLKVIGHDTNLVQRYPQTSETITVIYGIAAAICRNNSTNLLVRTPFAFRAVSTICTTTSRFDGTMAMAWPP